MKNGIYFKILNEHTKLKKRKINSSDHIDKIKNKFNECCPIYDDKQVCIYCAGSVGRGEVGDHSDLDIFILSKKPFSRLDELEILANIIEVNRELGFGRFSNDGQYLKVYSLNQMLDALGAPHDDSENLFTARILLLLESRPVYNESLYTEYLNKIINHYFRDQRGKRTFKPLFIINDLLRYWRTLCLNYELIRDNPERPWRKKNINLKFSRMLTIFGTVLPLIAKPLSESIEFQDLATFSPHDRFAIGLDMLDDRTLKEEYIQFLDNYESFLSWKEQMGSKDKITDGELDEKSRSAAKQVSDFIYKALSHNEIDSELRKYLVL